MPKRGYSSTSSSELTSLPISHGEEWKELRQQQLQALDKAQLIGRILQLEGEVAGRSNSVEKLGLNGQTAAAAKSKSAFKRVFVNNELIITILPFLTRWDLDAIPLVSRRFRTLFSASTLEQRRMIEKFRHMWGKESRHGGEPRNALYISRTRLSGLFRAGILPNKTDILGLQPENKIWLSDAELDRLLRVSPLLRARSSLLFDCHLEHPEHDVTKFSSLWDGCLLTVKCELDPMRRVRVYGFPPSLLPLGNCSTLRLGLNDGKTYQEDNGTIYFGMGVNFGRALFGSEESGLMNCRRIEILNTCEGVDADSVLSYLFITDGRKRELLMENVEGLDLNLLPENLKNTIKKRLESVGPQIPQFTLKVVFTLRLYKSFPEFSTELPSTSTAASHGELINQSQHGWTLSCNKLDELDKYILEATCF